MQTDKKNKTEKRQLALLLKDLPHINTDKEYGGIPFYKWQRDFFESTNKMVLLTAANQIGKSSIQIRKLIHWATSPKQWAKLWPSSHHNVAQFWYLYPTMDVATIEVKTKWEKEWLPRGGMKEHQIYGWKAEYRAKKIYALHFNSGVSIFFKSYAQSATDLQTGTCHYIATDEELPINLYDELKFRTSATDGYFSMAFTATLGQYEWECAMESIGEPQETFKHAHKIQVSLYDCLKYEDGDITPWTRSRIQDRIDSCSSEAEVEKRIMGRFVRDGDLKYANYITKGFQVEDWVFNKKYNLYSAVDPGSGGAKGHPTAISFLAVSPDYSEGFIFLGWRGDGVITTNADALDHYIKIRGDLVVPNQFYDYHAKDFYTFADRQDEVFQKAEKSHEIGEPILKSLLKYNALHVVTGNCINLTEYGAETIPGELSKLVSELHTLMDDTDKRNAKDDLTDTVRYNCAKVPWNWKLIQENHRKTRKDKRGGHFEKKVKVISKTDAQIIKERREMFDEKEEMNQDYENEINFWNDCYEI